MKKVKDYLDQQFIVVVGRGIRFSIIPTEIDKRFKRVFRDVLELDVLNTWTNPEGVVLYV